ncbi:MAG TPA: sigma-E factor negative regulatory protein [Burkholderiales bacterium]|nr:sigma-E factor negative regulatory protein [Burkholderiales bacterium]
MKTKISALVDGELERHEAASPLDALGNDEAAREAWRTYNLIGDAMRDTRMLSAGFAGRVAARLAEEPTVMAPSRLSWRSERPRWQLLSAAASLAAVAMVTSAWYLLQDGAAPAPRIAQVAAPVAQVSPPDSANDYLYAHQGYSPRNSLQGVAPYVRMVSSESRAAKQ